MLFKGTSEKSSLDIVKLIEGLGGSFDAYTTKENLVIVTKFLSEHIARVFNLITELLLESKIAHEDLVKEKSVILEEIKSNIEDPGDYVFDLFFQALFHNHAMGLPITGTEESLKKIDAEKTKAHYQELIKRELVIAVSGNFDYSEVFQLAKKNLRHLDVHMAGRIKPEDHYSKLTVQRRNEISQVHCVFGIPGVAYRSPLRYRFSILNTAFGGGMSSRLFQALREQEGLVYNVQSFIDLYSDCGVSGFYFVCDKNSLQRVAKQLWIIFSDIHINGFNKEEIELAKTYLSGNLLLSLENSSTRMLRLGREMSYLQRVSTIDNIIEQIRDTNEEHINELISEYLDLRKYSVAAIGPVDEKEIEDIFRATEK